MHGIDPQIIEHKIKIYDGAKDLWQKLQLLSLKKFVDLDLTVILFIIYLDS
jgi:hypothetical protein